MRKMLTSAPVDATCDQMGKKFIHDSLPPVLTESMGLCLLYQGQRSNLTSNDRFVGLVLYVRISYLLMLNGLHFKIMTELVCSLLCHV